MASALLTLAAAALVAIFLVPALFACVMLAVLVMSASVVIYFVGLVWLWFVALFVSLSPS